MNDDKINSKIINATKWATITEIVAKLITPITNMILARIISPQAFGVVATATMITSFADMFTDAGFQKYLVQHEFKSEEEKIKNVNVAFWTNLFISAVLLMLIIVFREKIANVVGNPGMGNVIAIASVQIILTSFSSMQMALYRRSFDFKTLFRVRIISIFIPFAITIPLAFLGLSYWALIIGSIMNQLISTIVLTLKSKWRPQIFYSIKILKEMISFSIWSLIEAISIWFTTWIDIFIIGNSLNEYYLGLYKTSTAMVNSIMTLITASIIPVFFSALSRLQGDDTKFNRMYFQTQKTAAIFILPLGVGVYLYSDLATKILLGSGWGEATRLIGIWALTSSLMIILGNLCSEVYRAKGKPKLSFLAQVLHLIVLIPACSISAKYGFWTLVYTRALIRLELIVVHLVIMQLVIGISIRKIIGNIKFIIIATGSMSILGIALRSINNSLLWNVISICLCIVFYFSILYLFPSMRKEIKNFFKQIGLKDIDRKYKKVI